MAYELSLRLALAGIFVLAGIIVSCYRKKAEKYGRSAAKKAEGAFLMAPIRLLLLITWLSIMLYLINPGKMQWAALPIAL